MSILGVLLGAAETAGEGEFLAQFSGVARDLRFFIPEILLCIGACLVLVADLFIPRENSRSLALVALVYTVAAGVFAYADRGLNETLFSGLLVLDSFAAFFKVVILGATAVAIAQSYLYREFEKERMGEYYAILLTASLGGCLMVSANDLFMFFLAIEFLSVPSYILVAFLKKNRGGSEAALKYIVYGGASSGLMLYGISLLYGLTGVTGIQPVVERLRAVLSAGRGPEQLAFGAAAFLALAGFGYKMAFVPMHFWCPDVYEGAPTPFTAYLSVASKAAGFGIFMRFLHLFRPQDGGAGEFLFLNWDALVAVLAALSMTLGNLAALRQRNVKRMLAYSSIAHAGYLLVGVAALAAPHTDAYGAVFFYFIAYFFMNLGAFLVVVLVSNEMGTEEVDGYRGLGRRSPLLAFALTLCLISLVGIPPTAGFAGKLQIFAAAWEVYAQAGFEGKSFMLWLLLLAVFNTAISVYYYARLLKAMYLDDVQGEPAPLRLHVGTVLFLLILVVPILYLGLFFDGAGEVTGLARDFSGR